MKHRVPHQKTFEQLVSKSGRVNANYKGVIESMYHTYYSKWTSVFRREQIHIVDGDRLITQPLAELEKVEKFLELPHFITEEHIYFNKTKGFYCIRQKGGGDGCLGDSKGMAHPEVDPAVIDKLQQFFVPHNQQFMDLTGRKFDWNYG